MDGRTVVGLYCYFIFILETALLCDKKFTIMVMNLYLMTTMDEVLPILGGAPPH